MLCLKGISENNFSNTAKEKYGDCVMSFHNNVHFYTVSSDCEF